MYWIFVWRWARFRRRRKTERPRTKTPNYTPLRKLAYIFGIIGVLVFIVYYQYAYTNFPAIKPIYSHLTNYAVYLSLSFAFFALGGKEESRIKLLIYYSIAEFWLFLVITYILNDLFDVQVVMHKVICAIFLTFSTSIVWYFAKLS